MQAPNIFANKADDKAIIWDILKKFFSRSLFITGERASRESDG